MMSDLLELMYSSNESILQSQRLRQTETFSRLLYCSLLSENDERKKLLAKRKW